MFILKQWLLAIEKVWNPGETIQEFEVCVSDGKGPQD